MKHTVFENPSDYDHDKVIWYNEQGVKAGVWYKWKENNTLCVLSCPKCKKENYSMAVSNWTCAWCEFNPNY